MEASEDKSTETAPETLPTELKEAKPKSTMMLAVIVAVIVVIAAIAAAFGLGLLGGKKEAKNAIPTVGVEVTSDVTVSIGATVSMKSLANDTDGEIVEYKWWFGDGAYANGSTLDTVTHVYSYGGVYLVWHSVTDNDNATVSNEGELTTKITVVYYQPSEVLSDDLTADPVVLAEVNNNTAPFAFMISDADIVSPNTTVNFNMSTSFGVGDWQWVNGVDNTSGQMWLSGPEYITSVVIDFGDLSAAVNVNTTTMVTSHMYTTPGHYAASVVITANNSGTNVSTTVKRTIHVLTPGTTSGGVKNKDTFIEATIGQPLTLDPAIDYESAGGNVIQNVYETLIWYNGTSASELVPMLVTAIPTAANGLISDDGMNYSFNLKAGVKFHDGQTMDADDVVYSFRRVLTIHDPTSPAWMIDAIVTDNLINHIGLTVADWEANSTAMPAHIVAYLEAQTGGVNHVITEADMVAVANMVFEKNDADTVTVHLTHAYSGFLSIMAYTMMSVVSKDFVEAAGHGNAYMRNHEAGTGPYKLVSWDYGSKIHLTRFADYWGAAPAIKDVYILKAEDVNTRMLMLQAGDADNIYLPIRFQDQFVGDTDYTISKGKASLNLAFMVFNFDIDAAVANSVYGGVDITNDFFKDIHMRKAFIAMMNYSLFISNVQRNNAYTPNGPIPKGMAGYNASTPVAVYDLDVAAAELKLTYNPNTGTSYYTSGFTIPMFFNSGNTARQTACTMIKSALEEISLMPLAGDMTATVQGLDWSSAYLPDVLYKKHTFAPIYVIGWLPDYYDPDDYATPFLDSVSGTYAKYSGYNNTTIDAQVRAAAVELDTATRTKMYEDLNTMVADDPPFIWLSQQNNFNIFRSWVKGVDNYYNPMYSDLYFPVFSK